MQIHCAANAARVFTMTFGAVLEEEFLTGDDALGLAFVRIVPGTSLERRLGDGAQDAAIVGLTGLIAPAARRDGHGSQ
jgi:hypothetical protein